MQIADVWDFYYIFVARNINLYLYKQQFTFMRFYNRESEIGILLGNEQQAERSVFS